MKRAAYNPLLLKAAETGTVSNSTALTGGSSSASHGAGGQPHQGTSRQYIPVCRVELVRERAMSDFVTNDCRPRSSVLPKQRDDATVPTPRRRPAPPGFSLQGP